MDVKSPPYSGEDEIRVLGSMLISKEAVSQALEILSPGDFYHGNHEIIFKIMSDLFIKDGAIDLGSIRSELVRTNRMEQVGGGDFLIGAINAITTAAHVGFHAEQVKNYSILRSLIGGCEEIIRDCYLHEDNPKLILEKAEKHIYSISETGARSQLQPISEIVHEGLENIDNLFTRKTKTTGLETGFSKLDQLTSGFQPGNMIILAARPGMGKTSMAIDIARNAAINNKIPTAFFSLEMTKLEIFNRIMSAMSDVPLYSLRTGRIAPDKIGEVAKAAEAVSSAPLYMDCSSFNMTSMGIRASCRRLANKMQREGTPLGLIVVDYLQLISSHAKRYDSRQSEVAEISRALKAISMDLNVPVLALSQLNRQTEESGRGGKPRLSDLRESGAIEQDADLVLFIYRQALYQSTATEDEKSKTKLIIAKHRNGALGEIDFYFKKETTRFYEEDSSLET